MPTQDYLPKTTPAPVHRSSRELANFVACSIALLIPCFWLPRIQAGDLASHVYNAWLFRRAESNLEPSLWIASQWTNTLFDRMLVLLSTIFGMVWGEQLAVSIVVLVFFWGAFFCAGTIAGRKPWNICVFLAMLSYGYTFHIGFFNFLLSLGLCLWALGLLWRPSGRKITAAICLCVIAFAGHALPVAWLGGVILFRLVQTHLRIRWRPLLLVSSICAIALGRVLLEERFHCFWNYRQIRLVSGADQFLIYGSAYMGIVAAALANWGFMLYQVFRARGYLRFLLDGRLHLVLVHSGAVFLLPQTILFSDEANALGLICTRMSLTVALGVLFLLATTPSPRWLMVFGCLTSIVYFGLLYSDGRRLMAAESSIVSTLEKLPPMQRVVSTMRDEDSMRLNGYLHLIDRACIGRCYSYGNYEPSSGHFRLRVRNQSGTVLVDPKDVTAIESGKFVVRESYLPLWRLDFCTKGSQAVCLTALSPGTTDSKQ